MAKEARRTCPRQMVPRTSTIDPGVLIVSAVYEPSRGTGMLLGEGTYVGLRDRGERCDRIAEEFFEGLGTVAQRQRNKVEFYRNYDKVSGEHIVKPHAKLTSHQKK